jgi:hypothetical protein
MELWQESRKVLKDESATKKSQKEATRVIDKSIMPMIQIAASACTQSANVVSPIGRSEYSHR